MKKNLPVILLRSTPFLPHVTLKLEIDNEESQNIIDTASFFHDNFILVGSKVSEDMPYIGVISKIKKKEKLPNGNQKVVIVGLERAYITNYLTKQSEILETLIEKIKMPKIKEEKEMMHHFMEKIKNFIAHTPTISNDIIEPLRISKNLSQMVDITASKLIKEIHIKNEVLLELDPLKRMHIVENYIEKIRQTLPKSVIETHKKVENIKRERKAKEKKYPTVIAKKLEAEKNLLKEMSAGSIEREISQKYIDTLNKIPFGIYSEDNLNIEDVKTKLDQTHFALESVKKRIVEFLTIKEKNPNIKSPILCLVGPSGVGKTTLAFSIAKALNRKFVKMSVGGIHDESEFVGHRRSYIGSRPGKIVTSLQKAKTMNPVFLIDEIDKIMQNGVEDPASTLLEILDPIQNRYFVDRYIEEEIDLSDVLFITTANKEEDIKEELKDRLEIIHIEGYEEKEKIAIAKTYLIPYLLKEYGLEANTVTFENEALIQIINAYTKERGLRELERKLSSVIRKIITENAQKQTPISKKNISKENLPYYLEKPMYPLSTIIPKKQVGVVNLLAYTPYGGEVVEAEVCTYKGKGEVQITGTVEEKMKESILVAVSYIKANASLFKINKWLLHKKCIHIHLPHLEKTKDGFSAGIAISSAILSSLTHLKISNEIAMTGEMTLTGKIIQIGKIKEKITSAYKKGIHTFIIPKENKEEVEELEKEILEKIKIYYVKDYLEVYEILKKQSE